MLVSAREEALADALERLASQFEEALPRLPYSWAREYRPEIYKARRLARGEEGGD